MIILVYLRCKSEINTVLAKENIIEMMVCAEKNRHWCNYIIIVYVFLFQGFSNVLWPNLLPFRPFIIWWNLKKASFIACLTERESSDYSALCVVNK